jgi:hypothetical protein
VTLRSCLLGALAPDYSSCVSPTTHTTNFRYPQWDLPRRPTPFFDFLSLPIIPPSLLDPFVVRWSCSRFGLMSWQQAGTPAALYHLHRPAISTTTSSFLCTSILQ